MADSFSTNSIREESESGVSEFLLLSLLGLFKNRLQQELAVFHKKTTMREFYNFLQTWKLLIACLCEAFLYILTFSYSCSIRTHAYSAI